MDLKNKKEQIQQGWRRAFNISHIFRRRGICPYGEFGSECTFDVVHIKLFFHDETK